MRFRGTLVLLVICIGLGAFLYFYEIKGGEEREKAKQEENRLWKVESVAIQQIELIRPAERITAVRSGEKSWKISAPRSVDADSEELNRLATSASDISRESVIEPAASDLGRFGLKPADVTLRFKTKDGKEYQVSFGNSNPTGNSTYAALEGKNEVFLVANYVASGFKKSLDDLRNKSVLTFEQFETEALDIKSAKGDVQLVKENDRWYLTAKERWAASSSEVNGILSALSGGRVKEFLEEPGKYADFGFDKPTADVRLKVGKDQALKHLTIGFPKSKLVAKDGKAAAGTAKDEASAAGTAEIYVARDESRNELFFVEKDLVDKLLKTPADLRDKALASFQRWDIDGITLTNAKGTFSFTKSGGDWVLGEAKKKTKWEAVNGILDAMEKPVKEFIDNPAAAATYGLDNPRARVQLRQGKDLRVECSFGRDAKDGVYAQVKGESSVKIADLESLQKIDKGESDFIESPTPTTPAQGAEKK